jgi:hypothetical protein
MWQIVCFRLQQLLDEERKDEERKVAVGSPPKVVKSSSSPGASAHSPSDLIEEGEQPDLPRLATAAERRMDKNEQPDLAKLKNAAKRYIQRGVKFVVVSLEPSNDLSTQLSKIGTVGCVLFSEGQHGVVEATMEQFPSELIGGVKPVSESGCSQAFLGALAFILAQAPVEKGGLTKSSLLTA